MNENFLDIFKHLADVELGWWRDAEKFQKLKNLIII